MVSPPLSGAKSRPGRASAGGWHLAETLRNVQFIYLLRRGRDCNGQIEKGAWFVLQFAEGPGGAGIGSRRTMYRKDRMTASSQAGSVGSPPWWASQTDVNVGIA